MVFSTAFVAKKCGVNVILTSQRNESFLFLWTYLLRKFILNPSNRQRTFLSVLVQIWA